MSEEKTMQTADSEFFNNFISEQSETRSMRIAKAQDQIDKLTERIEVLSSQKEKDGNTIKACEALIQSKAYPALSPIVSAFKDLAEKSSERKDRQISNAKKKIKKAERKIRKAENKLKKVHMLRDFTEALRNSENGRNAFVEGMEVLKEDSLQRSKNRLDNISVKIDKLTEKLNSPDLGNADRLKIKNRLKKAESKKEKLNEKIDNLTALDRNLNRLSEIELTEEKVRKLAGSAIETAEKAAAKTNNISEIIDDIALSSSVNIENTLNEEKQKDENLENTEKASEEKSEPEQKNEENKTVSFMFKHPVKRKVTSAQIKKLAEAGIVFVPGTDENKNLFAVFDKADLQKVDKALEPKQKQGLKK